MTKPVAKTRISKRDNEYIVLAYDEDGKRLPDADYFTNDKMDAVKTAELMTKKTMRPMRKVEVKKLKEK